MPQADDRKLDAFDSHFHVDRLASALDQTWDKTLGTLSLPANIPVKHQVNLVGGVMVFCDPDKYHRLPVMYPTFTSAIGVHPKKVHQFTARRAVQLKSLLKARYVRALGEVGLDHSTHPDTWPRQQEVLEQVLGLCEPRLALVLHLRGEKGDRHLEKVSRQCLVIVKKHCPKEQRIHLHCFSGGMEQLQEWKSAFPNCYFGLPGKVGKFTKGQREALTRVPADRLLIETDAPYMPMLPGLVTSSPAYIGEVGQLVATVRREPIAVVLRATLENGRRLYRMYQG